MLTRKKLRPCELLLLAFIACGSGLAKTAAAPSTPSTGVEAQQHKDAKRKIAEEQLKLEEHQRILGVIPYFNTTNIPDAVALSPKQKWQLAFKGAVDPFVFGVDALNAGISQLEDEYPEYGQGIEGFSKRFAANYADSFDGEILGNAVFPVLLHEDPRYFRKGSGPIKSRLWYAMESTFRCKNDNGQWVVNFGNLLGNLSAGGISNLYYPASERGFGLTMERGFTVTAEGAVGALAYEFWPDVQRHFRHHKTEEQATAP